MRIPLNRSDKTGNRTQKRASRTRSRLLQAALSLFAEKGYDATGIADITERADLGKGTFYRHFATKDEIMLVLTHEAVSQLSDRIRNGAKGAESLQDLTSKLLDIHRTFFEESNEAFILLFQGRLYVQFQREDAAALEEPLMEYVKVLQTSITPFVPEGVPPHKVRRLACALAGFVSGYMSFSMIGLSETEMSTSLNPLKQVFVSAATVFLKETPPSGKVQTGTKK